MCRTGLFNDKEYLESNNKEREEIEKTIELLIKLGADVNAKNNIGLTPLEISAFRVTSSASTGEYYDEFCNNKSYKLFVENGVEFGVLVGIRDIFSGARKKPQLSQPSYRPSVMERVLDVVEDIALRID